jgi:hypothetical protein
LDAASDANTTGLIGAKPTTASSNVARMRRIEIILLPPKRLFNKLKKKIKANLPCFDARLSNARVGHA